MKRRRAPLSRGASLARRCQPRAEPANRPLTPPVAPRASPVARRLNGAPEPLPLPSRQRGQLPRFEAPSIDKCSLPRLRGGSPPPCSRLCRREPASDALSLLDMLSHGGARPSTVVTGYSPVVVRTARRLPISAIETNCEHSLLDQSSPAHRAFVASSAAFYCGWPGPFRSAASRDFTGQGPLRLPSQRLPAAIARGGSLTPTRLARAPPVAILFPPGAGEAAAEDEPSFGGTSTGSPSWAPLARNPAL
jgi:hypothetical protein